MSLRIIGGSLKGRRLETPPDGEVTRPLPDRVRQSIFNMLRQHERGYTFADVFAGTGAFGIEALSRGARSCVFYERDRKAAARLQRNIESVNLAPFGTVQQIDALSPAAIARCTKPVHVVMFDPPYPMIQDPKTRERVFAQFARFVQLLDDDGFALLRTPWPFVDRYEDGEFVPPENVKQMMEKAEQKKQQRKTQGRRAPQKPDEDGDTEEIPFEEALALGADVPGSPLLDSLGYDGEARVDKLPVAPGTEPEEAGGEEDELDVSDGPVVELRKVKLKIEGAKGPESHFYGSTAVHWYMKKKP